MTTPPASPQPATQIVIGGRWRDGNGGFFEVADPADLTVVARVANGDVTDAAAAVDAAAGAAATWREIPPRQRSIMLLHCFELMIRDAERLAHLIATENGKSLSDARVEVEYAAEFFRWFAEEAVRHHGEFGPAPTGGAKTIVTHRPVGVAALITPWNFPAAMVTRKIAPALAAGCTVVLKPAPETPLTSLAIAHLIHEAGVPDGVVNVVPSTDSATIATTWLADPRVRKISFTGSTRVGSILLRQAADRVVNASMELGGNAPFVVADDADLDAAVDGALLAKFRSGGQACTAANRFYVHEDVHDEFVARFGAAIEGLAVGRASAGAAVGPVISHHAARALRDVIETAVSEGARVTHRAQLPDLPGHFVAPTLLVDVAPGAAILDHELFGPVAPVVRWHDESHLISQLNAPDVGLAAYVYSRDLQRAMRLAEQLEVGMVGINRGTVSDPSAPFGGVKQSGLGREGAREGLHEFTETQYLSVGWE